MYKRQVLYIKDRGIEKPQDLDGKSMGYTVAGMEDVLARAFCELNEIKDYTLIHVEFAIVPSLVSGRVDSVMGGFRNYEVVAVSYTHLDVYKRQPSWLWLSCSVPSTLCGHLMLCLCSPTGDRA